MYLCKMIQPMSLAKKTITKQGLHLPFTKIYKLRLETNTIKEIR